MLYIKHRLQVTT